MDVIQGDYNFDEIRATAKQIDRGIQNLEKKLSNINNLGYLLPAEKTKKIALDVLDEYENEINDMRENCVHCYEEEEKMLTECIENNHKVTDYLERLKNDLDKIENHLSSNFSYQCYQEPIQEQDLTQNEARNFPEKNNSNGSYLLESNNESQASEVSVTNHVEAVEADRFRVPDVANGTSLSNKSLDVYSLIHDSNHIDGLNYSIGNSLLTPHTSKTSSKLSEKIYETDLCSMSMSSLSLSCRKRANYADEACKTPVDPGISLASMKLLGKSHIKTKVYKSIVFDNIHKE